MLKLAAAVFVGSGLGGVLRFMAGKGVSRIFELAGLRGTVALFPWSTLLVNIVGCFLIGLFYGLVDSGNWQISEQTKLFLTTGICGGLTTFSTFTHENYLLFQSHNFPMVLLYAAASLFIGFACAYAGHALA